MGVEHLIFTLDNMSLKTFGDSDSVKILGEGQEIQHLVEQVLKRAKRVESLRPPRRMKMVMVKCLQLQMSTFATFGSKEYR